MSRYEELIRECRIKIVLRAVLEADGNCGAAAAALGVHRNLVSRVLQDGGYSAVTARRTLAGLRKPVQSASPENPQAALPRFSRGKAAALASAQERSIA